MSESKGLVGRRRAGNGLSALSLLLLAVLSILVPGAWANNGEPDAAPVPDACSVLSNEDLVQLLFDQAGGTLDSSSDRTDDSLSSCNWEARPRQLPLDRPPRRASLSIYQYDDDARAEAQMKAYAGVPDSSSDALVQGDSDAVAHRSSTIALARHGSRVAVLDANGAELENPNRREPRYLLDSLALKAAGARVRPRSWTAAAGDPSSDWIPARRPMPPWVLALQPLLAMLETAARWRLYLIVAGVFGGLIFGLATSKRRTNADAPPSSGHSRLSRGGLGVAACVLLFLNVLVGPFVSAFFIYHLGQSGSAAVVGSHGTATRYNNHDVVAHDVLLRTIDGQLIKTGFRDDDFNVFPGGNSVTYPGEGTVFTARYLPMFPKSFVIVADDGSPWAAAQRCDRLRNTANEQRTKLRIAPTDLGIQGAVQRADAQVSAAGCTSDQD